MNYVLNFLEELWASGPLYIIGFILFVVFIIYGIVRMSKATPEDWERLRQMEDEEIRKKQLYGPSMNDLMNLQAKMRAAGWSKDDIDKFTRRR